MRVLTLKKMGSDMGAVNQWLSNVKQSRAGIVCMAVMFGFSLPNGHANEDAVDSSMLDMTTISANVDYLQDGNKEDSSTFKVATIESTAPVKSITPVQQKQKTVVVTKKVSIEQQSLEDYQQAVHYLQQGRVAEAQDMLRSALVTTVGFDDARQALIGLLVENNRIDEAVGVLKEGVTISPGNTNFVKTLARLQLDFGDTDEALATLKQGIAYSNGDPNYHMLLAVVLQKLGQHQQAVLQYHQVLKRGAYTPGLFIGLGVSLEAEGRKNEAKLAFQKAQQAKLTPVLALFVSQRLKQLQ